MHWWEGRDWDDWHLDKSCLPQSAVTLLVTSLVTGGRLSLTGDCLNTATEWLEIAYTSSLLGLKEPLSIMGIGLSGCCQALSRVLFKVTWETALTRDLTTVRVVVLIASLQAWVWEGRDGDVWDLDRICLPQVLSFVLVWKLGMTGMLTHYWMPEHSNLWSKYGTSNWFHCLSWEVSWVDFVS